VFKQNIHSRLFSKAEFLSCKAEFLSPKAEFLSPKAEFLSPKAEFLSAKAELLAFSFFPVKNFSTHGLKRDWCLRRLKPSRKTQPQRAQQNIFGGIYHTRRYFFKPFSLKKSLLLRDFGGIRARAQKSFFIFQKVFSEHFSHFFSHTSEWTTQKIYPFPSGEKFWRLPCWGGLLLFSFTLFTFAIYNYKIFLNFRRIDNNKESFGSKSGVHGYCKSDYPFRMGKLSKLFLFFRKAVNFRGFLFSFFHFSSYFFKQI